MKNFILSIFLFLGVYLSAQITPNLPSPKGQSGKVLGSTGTTYTWTTSGGSTLNELGHCKIYTVPASTIETVMDTLFIPKKTFSAEDMFTLYSLSSKTYTASTCSLQVYINTTNSFAGSTLLAYYLGTALNLGMVLSKSFYLYLGKLYTISALQSQSFDNSSNKVNTVIPFDVNLDYYIFFTHRVPIVASGDVSTMSLFIKP